MAIMPEKGHLKWFSKVCITRMHFHSHLTLKRNIFIHNKYARDE